jgi:hypothetical protein
MRAGGAAARPVASSRSALRARAVAAIPAAAHLDDGRGDVLGAVDDLLDAGHALLGEGRGSARSELAARQRALEPAPGASRRGTRRAFLPSTLPPARTRVTFMEATPAKWKVLSVIWVPGSPMDCAPTAPTVEPGGGAGARRRRAVSLPARRPHTWEGKARGGSPCAPAPSLSPPPRDASPGSMRLAPYFSRHVSRKAASCSGVTAARPAAYSSAGGPRASGGRPSAARLAAYASTLGSAEQGQGGRNQGRGEGRGARRLNWQGLASSPLARARPSALAPILRPTPGPRGRTMSRRNWRTPRLNFSLYPLSASAPAARSSGGPTNLSCSLASCAGRGRAAGC